MLQDQSHISMFQLLQSNTASLKRLQQFISKDDFFLLAKIKLALLVKRLITV